MNHHLILIATAVLTLANVRADGNATATPAQIATAQALAIRQSQGIPAAYEFARANKLWRYAAQWAPNAQARLEVRRLEVADTPDNLDARCHLIAARAAVGEQVNTDILAFLNTAGYIKSGANSLFISYNPNAVSKADLLAFYRSLLQKTELTPATAATVGRIRDQISKLE